jgi:hypothetical protein
MTTQTQRLPRRPALHLPLYLCAPAAEAPSAPRGPGAFPLSAAQLRRAVAEMIG